MKINNSSLCIFSSIFPLTLILFLAACQANIFGYGPTITPMSIPVDLQDRSWLTGDPCSPPCWYGLHLDRSTEEEVVSVLESLPFVVSTDIEESIVGYGDALTEENYNATQIQIEKINNLNIHTIIGKGVLKKIGFGLNYKITIDEVVKQIGVPDVIRMMPDFNRNSCEIEFFWLDKQLVLISGLSGSDWKEKCKSIDEGNSIDRKLSISYVKLIYQNWLTALMERVDEPPWPGFSE